MDPQIPGTPIKHTGRNIFILSIVFLLLLVFGVWAYSGMQTNKKKADRNTAVAADALQKQKDAESKYDALLKQPYKTFMGPSTYGSVSFNYPKNYSAYVDQTNSNEPVNGYFYPDIVPGLQSNTAYPLRIELLNQDYASVLEQFNSAITQGSIKSSAFIPDKLKTAPNVTPGVKLDGAIGQASDGTTLNGSMIIIKVRDKTLQIYTETRDSLTDFNGVVLPSLTFVP